MKRYRVFGFYDEAWWELWEGRNHRAATPANMIARIREDLLLGGEEQYEAIAVVPADAFTVEHLGPREVSTAASDSRGIGSGSGGEGRA